MAQKPVLWAKVYARALRMSTREGSWGIGECAMRLMGGSLFAHRPLYGTEQFVAGSKRRARCVTYKGLVCGAKSPGSDFEYQLTSEIPPSPLLPPIPIRFYCGDIKQFISGFHFL